MRRQCRERFPRHWQRTTRVSDPGMHHGTWCMLESLTCGTNVAIIWHENDLIFMSKRRLHNNNWLRQIPLRKHVYFALLQLFLKCVPSYLILTTNDSIDCSILLFNLVPFLFILPYRSQYCMLWRPWHCFFLQPDILVADCLSRFVNASICVMDEPVWHSKSHGLKQRGQISYTEMVYISSHIQ